MRIDENSEPPDPGDRRPIWVANPGQAAVPTPSSANGSPWRLAKFVGVIIVVVALLDSCGDSGASSTEDSPSSGWDQDECIETMNGLADGYEAAGEPVSQARRDSLIANNC